MDYFKILNLNREPFSNSPEPEFFCQSFQHLRCLQKLELAIRLHRGLNVVLGNVGTGKTTLCRELLIRFAKSEEDRNDVETHLLLDPAISTPREFLATVAADFGITPEAADSEWHLKEGIKHHLFRRGVDEKKTVLLIVDEGQKLPAFGLELLREFLNYETNEAKLLQIVIFAQNEFREILGQHPNFADRVNQLIALGPLNFRETRQLVAFRIAQASVDKPPRLFTWPGLWAVYRATGGYPRKIITLCHQSILAMIIQNRKRAGWFTVRSCAERISTERPPGWRRVLVAASTLVALLLAAAVIMEWRAPLDVVKVPVSEKVDVTSPEKKPFPAVAAGEKRPAPVVEKVQVQGVEKKPVPTVEKGPVQGVEKKPAPTVTASVEGKLPAIQKSPLSEKGDVPSMENRPAPALAAAEKRPAPTVEKVPVQGVEKKPAPTVEKKQITTVAASVAPPPASPALSGSNAVKPKVLGTMVIEPGETFYGMLMRVYGAFDGEQMKAFLLANPRIENIDEIRWGDIVTFPAIPARTNPLPPGQSWVAVLTKGNLEEGCESLRIDPRSEVGIRLFPYWNSQEGLVFAVLIRKGFPDEKAAGAFIQRLPAEFIPGARVISRWPEGTEFYAR